MLLPLLDVVAQVASRREELRARADHAPGMLDAIVAAELVRPQARAVLEQHYCVTMPALLRDQLNGRLFGVALSLSRMPRLRAALEALFAIVADAGLSCEECLGAAMPAALIGGRTLGEVYSRCHFGRSMPMLYASAMPDGVDPVEWIDSRLVGPLVHELSHLLTEAPPGPANVHESLAAWIGSEAWPAQIWPEEGAFDAIPGTAYFAAVGGWIARALGPREALRVQAGVLDLRDALGPACAEALRLYGFLPFLATGAPHLLADAFHPARWWKLIDLHRDPSLAREFQARHVVPLLAGDPSGDWDVALDALSWRDLPAFRDVPNAIDRNLARRAEQAMRVRAVRRGLSFATERADPPGAVVLDRDACELRAPWPGADAIGAPAVFPWPPALAARIEAWPGSS